MELVNSVFEISESFMKNPEFVQLDWEGIAEVTDRMLDSGVKKFPPQFEKSNLVKDILMEFVGDSINYCYWYGTSNIRPGGASSGLMYKLVEEAFESWNWHVHGVCINNLITLLAENRFPLLEERKRHLKELSNDNTVRFMNTVSKGKHFDDMFIYLIQNYPGYASDIFLKRASLFFIQLFRKFGLYEEEMHKIHVPADYQVPKLLEYNDCIIYSDELEHMIENNVLIPKHSKIECEIRAATVLACRELMKNTGWNIADVDGWFWLRRKEVTTPFHLTITTDY
jgi:hypothetical protein